MLKYTDIYVQTIARGLMTGNEQLLGAAAAVKSPFIKLGPWFDRHYLVLSTNQRVILVEHRKGLLYARLNAVESFAWNQIEELKIKGLFAAKKLVLHAGVRKLALKLTAFLGPLPNNLNAARAIESHFEQSRSLPAAAAPVYLAA
jgi:hypothetical protein